MKYLKGIALTLFCGALFFLWVNAGARQISFFPYKPNQIAVVVLLAVGFLALFSVDTRRSLKILVGSNKAFVGLFLFFVTLQLLSILWVTPEGNVQFIVGKQLTYFLATLFIAAALHGAHALISLRAIYFGLLAGLLAFGAVFAYLSSVIGDGLVSLIVRSFIEGNSAALQFGVFPSLFNFVDGGLIGKDDADFQGTALRNTLVGVFVITAILFWCRSERLRGFFVASFPYLGAVVTVICGFFILASVSRSNMLVFILAACVVVFMRLLAKNTADKSTRSRATVLIVAIAGMAFVSGNLLLSLIEGLSTIGSQRFGNVAEEPRLVMYGQALAAINRHPFAGIGLGAELPIFEHRVHNLFLAAWFEGGIPLLLGASAMYAALFRSVLKCARAQYKLDENGQKSLLLNAGGILAISILPLFRPLISGDGGAFTLVEWFCIALLLAESANLKRLQKSAK